MTKPLRTRAAIDGAYQRGIKTRAKIVEAALLLFGEKGFEGATTRDIAERAGVNAPALIYYFNHKEGVYLACVEYIAERLSTYMSASIHVARTLLDDPQAKDDALIDAFCVIQTHFAEFLLVSGEPASWRLFMAREQAGLSYAGKESQSTLKVNSLIISVCTEIAARLIGLPSDAPETIVRVFAITGQLLTFHLTRRAAMAELGWEQLNTDRFDTLIRIINEQTVSLLTGMTEARTKRQCSPV